MIRETPNCTRKHVLAVGRGGVARGKVMNEINLDCRDFSRKWQGPHLVVALGAVECADDEVDDAEVVDLLVGVVVRHVLLLPLDLLHQLLRLPVSDKKEEETSRQKKKQNQFAMIETRKRKGTKFLSQTIKHLVVLARHDV
jgi:hypothetical protein